MHSTPFVKPERGLINVIRSRFLSFSMVLGVGFYCSCPSSPALLYGQFFLSLATTRSRFFLAGGKLYFAFGVTTVLFGLITSAARCQNWLE